MLKVYSALVLGLALSTTGAMAATAEDCKKLPVKDRKACFDAVNNLDNMKKNNSKKNQDIQGGDVKETRKKFGKSVAEDKAEKENAKIKAEIQKIDEQIKGLEDKKAKLESKMK